MDIHGDGQLSILSGCYSRMEQDMAGLLYLLHRNKDGSYAKAEVIKGTDGEPLIIPTKDKKQLTEKICTRPFAIDWDGDGKMDLVVGNFSGTFYWFKGDGKGRFAPTPQMLMADGKPLKVPGAHSDPFVIDWDGDGALDIVSGCVDGGVYWARNRAGKGKPPELEAFKPLIKPGKAVANGASDNILREEDLTGPSHASRIWVADVNGDGKLDILVGDMVHLISPAKGVTEAQFKEKNAAWQKEFQEALKAMNAAKDDKERTKASEEYTKIYQRRSQFMHEEMTGFVWVYIQK